ncbi:G5 domain-containing protein [Corynebacterium sp. UMB10119B.1]|uniref:G5 domain-containing protein n=1 Tax=Corynebacterium sp. UMB10119B.1 TaxID=3050601 RepID=UPI00254D065B|nr:G5 domain-containing protein [Corynebacterium sp. UMB10119B]MDK8364779.1 G5 domain-containing protein [Corynebacterium sp. UMB10119B]
MAESSRRLRKSTSTSIAATSAIALALGGLSVVGPGPLAPYAAAEESAEGGDGTTFTGGIRDKSGAVEKDTQKASDLPAGSCVVSEADTAEHSQAGFSWNTHEPGTDSTDKTLWGLSVSFDNSKDRTFADWSFTNGGNLGKFLGTDNVPSMEAGQTFLDESVTHKADESIDITGSRDQRNLNLYAALTDAKVKQFASATADNPVRYAWQGNYTKDHTSGLRATRGGSAAFSAVVNPWPSENIECNPITVSWENWEKHVIVPGPEGETKVGKINIPTVTGQGTDDSMSRMVVEAYDGNGKFIGTTDPAVSGGEQLLRVDKKTGEIFFTWPEYRGTDLATDKNVTFSVLAKPRSVDQLKAAAKNNNEYLEHDGAFDSSNSLDRYSKANVIGSKAFSLDDTEYHDPKYDKTDASIISGVDSATGPLATEPQKVTFTQTPDLIKDLAKKKDQKGFEAKATLDEKYVYEGWSVEMDEDYNVTVTAPEEPRPGTFARPVVTVEYSNGSTDELELLVVVDPNNTQVTDLVRPGLTKGTIGKELTAQVGTKSIMKGHKPVHPAKFEIDESTVPEGWKVTVDETGKVTAKADDTVAPGTIITPTVKATYPDQTTDEIETQFQAIVDIKIPEYDTVTNKPNAKVSLTPNVPERGLSGNTTDEAPERYTFEDEKTEITLTSKEGKTWTVKIDEKTGKITTTIPKDAPEGDILDVPVLAHYENADKPQNVKGTVVVIKGDVAPVYDVQVTGPNQAIDHQVTGAPEGSTYSFGNDEDGNPVTEQEVDGWKYTIDPKTGVVSSTPPATAKPGDKKTITVTVQTPDGSRPEVPVTTVVKHTNSWEAEPVYPVETVYPGEAATLPVDLQKPEDVNVAKENPYKLGDVPAGWNVSIDDNGRITATAPADAKPGTQVKIPVTVTYEDGSTDIAYAVVNVLGLPEREEPFEVEYKFDESLPAGEYKVETKGEPGAAKMHKDGTWERTKAPKNEVVVIGTKPAESAKNVTWKFPIPYPTEVRENPELKPGEMKTVQEGVNGEKIYTAKFTSKGSEAQVAEDETIKEAKPRIIEVGPGIPDQELTSKKTQEVPFEIEYVYDDTLESGKQVVDEEGVPGEQTITSTQKIKDGKPDGEPSINIEQTKAPKKAKIRIGTKTAGETKKTVESEVPFGVKIEYDPNMPAGTSEVVTEGKPGKKTTTVTQKVTNSQPDGEATVEEKVTEQPVDQVIKVGTKPSETSEKVEWKAPVPFEVETRPNKDLKPGEIKVVQKGEPGEKTYTANFTSKGDDSSVKPEEKQTKDPVKEIIEYGPTTPDQTLTSTKTREVNYETEFIVDNTVPVGQTKVEQEGEKGEELITSTQKIKDGKPDGEPNITVEQTKAPKKKIVRVGSMTNGTYELEEKLPIPFDTVVEYDPEIPAGEYKIVTKGQPGEKTTKITQKIENSKVVDAKRGETTNSEPVTEVIKVGTKQATASDKVEWKEPIPYPTELRPNLNLAPGEVRVVQQGKDGEATYTATFTGTNGEAAKTEETARTEPTPRIVEFGPGLEDDSVVSKTTRLVEFETEIVEDPNLEEGKQVIEQGEFGEEVVTSTQKLVDGKPSGEPEVKTERTKEPKKAIIRVGTKKPADPTPPTPPTDEPEQPTPPTDEPGPSIDPKEVKLPFTTKIIYDETLEPGQEIVDQEGANGKVEVTVEKGQPSVKVVKEPVERIIRVGTKPPADIEWNERIPFEVKVKLDPTIEAGKHKVEQEGKPGLVHHKSDGTEETLVEKQDHVILIGTKKPGDDPENPEQPEQPTPGGDLEIKVRYTTRIVYDPNLKPGEEVEDVAGKDGRYTIKVVDGSPVAEMVEKPVERVVRVGTKPPAGTSWTEEVAYDYEVVEDPNLESGKHEVVQPGKPGQRIHKEDGSVVEVAPQKLIIKVGTKKSPADPTDPSKPTEPSTPAEPGANGSSEKAKRCAANAFAVNSPLLWLLPIGLLAGIGYGVNEAFGPQLQQAGAELNARFQESMPKRDWGHGQQGRRHEDPEWVRELRVKADAVNRQFAGYGEQLRPLGIALGAIAAVSMLGVLIAQACEEDGFNNGLTILGSSKGDTPADKAGSSEQK